MFYNKVCVEVEVQVTLDIHVYSVIEIVRNVEMSLRRGSHWHQVLLKARRRLYLEAVSRRQL
jgi:hypothetical protein